MPYLTTAEYVRLFGEVEAIRLTDESKTGTPDAVRIADTIAAQETIMDSYLVDRYVLPFSGSHPMLEQISAALTREALHKTRVSQAVTDQADRARSQLRDLSAGRAKLPVAVGDTPTIQQPGDLAARSGDGRPRVFTDSALADFTDLGGGGGGRTFFHGPGGY